MSKFTLRTSLLSLSVAVLLTMSGCSGGGGSDDVITNLGGGSIPAPSSVASLGGTLGSSSSVLGGGSLAPARAPSATPPEPEGFATLVVDSNGNDIFGGEDLDDFVYTTPIVSGAFVFNDIGLNPDANTTRAFLTVAPFDKAPYTEIVSLSDNDALSILAEVSKKPVLTQVFDIASLSQSARETSFLRFGMKESGSGVEAFSKLMSLSEFRAMAENNVTLKEGELSSSVIPTANLPEGLKTLTVEMQSYSSADEDDFKAFPGDLTGFGKDEGVIKSQAAADPSQRVKLESAGFDLLKLLDENGNIIDLDNSSANQSKLRTFADGATCNGMSWTRRLYSNEVEIIKRWGDDDNTTDGYQVPIWSNDNATGAWSYIGLATIPEINASSPVFTICVDKKWQGYLNCDSPLATSAPQQICVSTQDQNGNLLGGISITGKKGGSYAYGTTGSYRNKGHTVIEVRDANISEWKYAYRGALTGWSNIDIDTSDISTLSLSSNPDCKYDMNLTVHNPYTSIAHIQVYAIDDVNKSNPLVGEYVRVYNGEYANAYNKGARTDANGSVLFEIKPDIDYKVTYKSGESVIKANGTLENDETEDTTREVYAKVQDKNVPPTVDVYAYGSYISNETKEMGYFLSARDNNKDTLTFKGLFIDDILLTKDVHYTVSYSREYDGYYYMRGVVKLDALPSGISHQLASSDSEYVLSTIVTDGVSGDIKDTNKFYVKENQAPNVSALYLKNNATKHNYYQSSSNIPEGNYTLTARTYDRERNAFDTFIRIGNDQEHNITSETFSQVLTKGDYNISVRVKETSTDGKLESTRVYENIHIGNHAPHIGDIYVSDEFVNSGESVDLTANVYDSEYDDLNVTATLNGVNYKLTKVYGSRYKVENIVIDSNSTFSVKAFDGEDYSNEKNISVTINTAPTFNSPATTLGDREIFTGANESFVCNATDPDGTTVSYNWFVNGEQQYSYARYYYTSFSKTFDNAGDYNVSCSASDRDGASSSKDANISVRVNLAPVFDTNITTTISLYEGNSRSFTCSAYDPEERGTVSFTWDKELTTSGIEAFAAHTSYSDTKIYLFNTIGEYYVTCTATDIDGKQASSTATVNVIANSVPEFDTPLANTSVVEDTNITLNCLAHDPEQTAVTYSWLRDGTIASGEVGTSFTTSFNTVQTHTVSCVATDADGKVATSTSNITVIANQIPTFDTPLTNTSVVEDTNITLSCLASDPEQTVVTYSWLRDGTIASGEVGTSFTTSFNTVQTHTVSCVATDADGKVATSTSYVTVTANQAPEFNPGLSDSSVDVNTTVDFSCSATDPEGTAVTYSWTKDGTTVGDTSSSYSFFFDTIAVYNIVCTATDEDAKSATSSARVTVGTQNQPPIIDTDYYDLYMSVNGGATVSGTVEFHDPDGTATIAIALDPHTPTPVEGFSINAETGAFSYDSSAYASLAEGQTEYKWINLIVTDNEGATAWTNMEISVVGTYVAPIPAEADVVTLPYTFYEINPDNDIDGNGPGLKVKGMAFDGDTNLTTETREALYVGSTTLVPRTSSSSTRYELDVSYGYWFQPYRPSPMPFTHNEAGNLIYIPYFNAGIILANSEDVGGQTKYVAAIDANVTFSSGASFDTLKYRNRVESIIADEKEQYNGQDVTSLEDFMNHGGGVEGDETSYVTFALDSNITTLDINQTGTLKELTNQGAPVSANVGTWEYKRMDNGEGEYATPAYGLIINITSGNFQSTETQIVVIINGAVFRGFIQEASETFTSFNGVVYNATAKEDIINAVIKAPLKTPISDLLSAGNGVWGEYGSDEKLHSCYVYSTDGTFTFTEGKEIWTIGLQENSNQTLNWLEDNGSISTKAPLITVANGYSASLMNVNMLWSDDEDNRQWVKMDSCSLSTPAPAFSSELNIEELTFGTGTWSWQDFYFDGSAYVLDPNRPARVETLSDETTHLSINGGHAYVKYLDNTYANEFNSTIFGDGGVHKIAYIQNIDVIEHWNEEVQDYSTGTGVTYTSISSLVTDYVADKRVYSTEDLPSNQGYILVAENILQVIDMSDNTIVTANAGTYDFNDTVLITHPTVSTRSYNNAFVLEDGKVYYADWTPANNGGIFYLFDETARNTMIAWFNANASSLTDGVNFGEGKVDFRTEFDGYTTQSLTSFTALTLYSLEVDQQENSVVVSGPSIDFTALAGQTIFFQNTNGSFGVRTFDSDGTTRGLLSYAGYYRGTYTTHDNVIDINNSGVMTTLSFATQPNFTDIADVNVSVGTGSSLWNSVSLVPEALLNRSINYIYENGTRGNRLFTSEGIAYHNGAIAGGYMYDSSLNVITILYPDGSVVLDVSDLSAVGVKVRDVNDTVTFSTTSSWDVGGTLSSLVVGNTIYTINNEDGVETPHQFMFNSDGQTLTGFDVWGFCSNETYTVVDNKIKAIDSDGVKHILVHTGTSADGKSELITVILNNAFQGKFQAYANKVDRDAAMEGNMTPAKIPTDLTETLLYEVYFDDSTGAKSMAEFNFINSTDVNATGLEGEHIGESAQFTYSVLNTNEMTLFEGEINNGTTSFYNVAGEAYQMIGMWSDGVNYDVNFYFTDQSVAEGFTTNPYQ